MNRTLIRPASLQSSRPTPRPGGGRRAVAKACNHCRVAHIACNEEERPCQRCVRLGRGHLCEDVPARKRGRPAWRLSKAESPEPQFPSSSSSSEGDAPELLAKTTSKRRKITPMESSDEEERRKADHPTGDRQATAELKDQLVRLSELVMRVVEELRTLQHSNKAFEQRMAAVEARLSALQTHHHHHYQLDPNHDVTAISSHSDPFPHPPQPLGSSLDSSATEAQLWTLRDSSMNAGHGWGVHCLSPTTLPSLLLSSSSSSSSTPTPTSELVPFDSELAVLRSSLPEWSALEEMRQQLPFLRDFPLSPKNFVVSDTRYPIMASMTTATAPVPCYANEAFTSLCGYSQEELAGLPINRLLSRGKNTHDHLRDILTARSPNGVSRVVCLSPILRHRNGATFRVSKRCQFFSNQYGEVYRCVVVIDSWRPAQLAEGEVFGW